MRKNLMREIHHLPIWVWVICMMAGGGCSIGISRAEIQPFYVEALGEAGKGKQPLHIGRDAATWLEDRRSDFFSSEDDSGREIITDGTKDWFYKDLSLFKREADLPERLNSAYYYDEGVPHDDVSKSVAGRIYEILSKRDSEWIHAIYQLGQIPPEDMALRLGAPAPGVPEWNRINVRFYNGDHSPISGYSNAREILSVISVYNYFHQTEDYDSFRSYADKLWNSSHSYNMSMSDVYYCEGECKYTEKDVGDEVLAEESELRSPGGEESAQGEDIGTVMSATDESGAESARNSMAAGGTQTGENSTGTGERTVMPWDGGPTGRLTQESGGADGTEKTEDSGPPGENKAAEGGGLSDGIGAAENDGPAVETGTAGTETAAETGTNEASETSSYSETKEGSDVTESSTADEGGNSESSQVGQEGEDTQEETNAQAETAGQATPASAVRSVPQEVKREKSCKGHVDLNISVRIAGLKENKNLYILDSQGSEAGPEGSGWNGWDEAARAYVQTIADQDWYDQYGLASSTSMYVRNPLSASEIQAYLNMLPPGTSPIRREIVKQALMSVGCIPYYWGGKPSRGGFDGNNFGSIVSADEAGRVLRGLDCSGWINWVYWTVRGSRLPYESTAGLINCGRGISKEELQAGDILIRGGEERHVYMFLAWAENGSMYLIHETTGTVNNVTINTYDLDLPYYRSLVEE